MDVDTATRFITSLTKSLQAVIHGCLDFERDIELGGYVYLRVDNAQRVDYVLSEKMQKSGVNSMTFLSNSFHAIPQASPDQTRPSQHKDSGSASVVETAGKLAASGKTHTMPVEAESPRFSTSHSSSMPSHQRSASGSTKNSNSFLQPQAVGDNDEFQMVPNNLKWPSAATTTGSSKHSRSTAEVSRSNDRTQSLTDFQTAFRSPPTITSQSQQSPSLSHTFSFPQNGSSSRPSSGQPLHHQQHHQQQQQQQQQQGKSGILPDASEMEVVHIKTEEEDEVFSIRLQCQQGGSEADGLTAQGKAPCLPMRMQQPFYFPYPRLARSQSWERHVNMAATGPKHPFFQAESGSDTLSLTCKICGKSYRSRQGLLFHERAKHQNVFNVYCPVCGKGFQQTTHMYGHMATHTNVKNFQCQACGAKYAHKTSLQQHLRSGSCRSSQISSPAGLDLSTSQILREFAPFNLCDAQSRPSPSGHSQSPLDAGSGQGHAETEGTLNQTQSPRFSHADLPSPDSIIPSVSSEDRHDNLSDQAAGLNVTTGNQATSLKLSSGDQAQPNDMPLTSENHARGVNLTSENHAVGLNLTSDDHRTDLNLTSRDAAAGDQGRGLHTMCQDEAVGVDMTKESQAFGASRAALSVGDNTFDGQDAVYRHDCAPEAIPLSLSADSTESKVDILQSLTDSQLQASVAGILQSPPSSTQQPGGGAHMGWLDTHLSSLPMQPDTQPPDPFHLQSMMTPQSAASSSSTFLSVPCQPLAQSTPRWFKTPSPASLQNRFSKVSCGLCGHISLTPHAHARHMTIRHSRRGDFACGECGKVFQTKLYLNQHMKSHGERKFACEVCGQKFFYKHHLPRHQLAVHGAITCSTNRRPRGEPQEQPSVAVDNPT